ncbi:MAG: AAA family ATPase [Planctomycetes bacterium]|nr:AAA family ATPase [Planctomycetota bacterium]
MSDVARTAGRHQAHGLVAGRADVRAPRAPWAVVSGGKGGVGKTLIAVNAAVLLAASGRRTLLVDLDPGLGDVHVHLRMAPLRTLEDVLDGDCPVAAACTPVRPNLRVLTGRSGSDALARGDLGYLGAALDAVAVASDDCDVVVCDTGAGIGPAVIESCRRAQLTLAVTTPDPAAATDAYALLKVLDRKGIATPQLVVNRVRCREDAMRTTARLAEVSRRFLGHGIEAAGWLCDDPGIGRSIRAQRPFAETGAGPALEDLRALAAAVAARLPAPRRGDAEADARTALRRLTAPPR